MSTVWNIRGTNGSGKTTLARRFLPPNLRGDAEGGPVDLNCYPSPTKRDPERQLRAEGYMRWENAQHTESCGVIGSYVRACGGMDTMPSFGVQQDAIRYMIHRLEAHHVICEGILAAGVVGSWGRLADELREQGHRFVFTYLSTPLDVCIERIRARQAATGRVKECKWEQIEAKWHQVVRSQELARAAGHEVLVLPHKGEYEALVQAMRNA